MTNIIIKESFPLFENISCIIFDKDGTLTDSNVFWSEIIKRRSKEILNTFNLNSNNLPFVAKLMGLDVNSNLLLPEGPIALKSRKEVIKNVHQSLYDLNENITEDSINNIFLKVHQDFKKESYKFIKPIETACEFAKKCKNHKLKLALISSDTELNCREALKHLLMENIFDFIIGGDSGFGDKEDGKSAKYICQLFNLNSKEVISIGDAPSDYFMSINSDLSGAILVETGQIPKDTLLKLTPSCINNLSEITLN